MKRILIYLFVLGAALAVPAEGTDVGKLQPVGLVQLYIEDGMVFIRTDTGDSGVGHDVTAAFKNLEDTTSGVIYLDTADFLLVNENAVGQVHTLGAYLKPSIRACIGGEDVDPVEAAEYLTTHRPTTRLSTFEQGSRVEKLVKQNARLHLE